MVVRRELMWITLLAVLLPGCLSPHTTRFPTFGQKDSETERRAYQLQDPYPDSRIGPSTGFRPLGFEDQRSEAQNAKDRFYGGFQKMVNNGAQRPVQPMNGAMLPPGQVLAPGQLMAPGQAMQVHPGAVRLPPQGAVVLPPQQVVGNAPVYAPQGMR